MAFGDDLSASRISCAGLISPLTIPDVTLLPGTFDANASYLGQTSVLGLHQGTVNIGMGPAPFAIHGVKGSNHLLNACKFSGIGDFDIAGNLRVTGAEFRASTAKSTLASKAITIAGKTTNITGAKVMIAGASLKLASPSTVCTGSITSPMGIFSAVAAPFKLFDIPHPSKEGMRLKHCSLEGPEIGVYYRGKLNDGNYIELPDYWDKLIDPESITVNLTSIGRYQELYVDKIEWGKRIKIMNNSGSQINCHYTIYAERIDVDKLVVEVEDKE
tara:strand:- start:1371 stop:2189 length:819 start_codon:yes stop_codon:yes gene_type:complete